MNPAIPDKRYFKIGEVAELVGVEPHVLRFWETQFARIKPDRNVSKQRRYRRQDVELFLKIKILLYEEQYTIPGARKKLDEPSAFDDRRNSTRDRELLLEIKERLHELKKFLETE